MQSKPAKRYVQKLEEICEYGQKTTEFSIDNLDDAKVITHAINEFLLEYIPYNPKGKEKKNW